MHESIKRGRTGEEVGQISQHSAIRESKHAQRAVDGPELKACLLHKRIAKLCTAAGKSRRLLDRGKEDGWNGNSLCVYERERERRVRGRNRTGGETGKEE